MPTLLGEIQAGCKAASRGDQNMDGEWKKSNEL